MWKYSVDITVIFDQILPDLKSLVLHENDDQSVLKHDYESKSLP